MSLEVAQFALLALVAVGAGALNAVAGGGSFLTFPSMVVAGVPPIVANATNTVALWPGALASAGAYRRELRQERRVLLALGAVALAGGLAGALLLLNTPERTFTRLVPWLLLGATAIFAFGPSLARALRGRSAPLAVVVPVQFVIAVYGGYFGGGIGILMLAALSALGMSDVHRMNALKVLLALAINGVAVVAFAASDIVDWPLALVMASGAIVGGYGGAHLAKRAPQAWVRAFVILVGLALSAYFFWRA